MHTRSWTLCLLFAVVPCLADSSYYRDVRPILQKNCQGCHQPASKMSGLDLTNYDGFKKGGKRGPSFVAGDPATSAVIGFMTGAQKPSMPLGLPLLAPAEVEIVREWIKAGAKDDSPREELSNAPSFYKQAPVITALRFSPDGKYLAVGGNREVLLHNADGSGLVKRLQGKAERILSIAFSADSSMMVAGGGTPARLGEIQLWDVRNAKLLRTAELTTDTVFGASMSPDGKKVVVGCTDNTVHGFDTATGKELFKMSSHENWVLGTVFGIDSKRFVSVGRDRAAKLVDANAGQFLENVNQLRGELTAVARHPKKDVIIVGGDERFAYIYSMDRPRNLKVGEEATLVRKLDRQDGPIFSLDWSSDGTKVAVAGAAPNVAIYNADTGDRIAACSGHTAGIYTVSFSPDGKHLATGGFDGQVRIYNSSDCKLERAFIPVPITGETGAGGAQ